MVLLSESDIVKQYDVICKYHKKYLEQYGVKLSKLKCRGLYTKESLVLVYLSLNYPDCKEVSKNELTEFIRVYYPDISDVQQARHLNTQKGWWIISGTRNDSVNSKKISNGNYLLFSLEKPSPIFNSERRKTSLSVKSWEELKESFNYRCATCGSKEGEESFRWIGTITKLQKGHMDPSKPLELGNIIPQCTECNTSNKNKWIYDFKGCVTKISDAKIVTTFDEQVQRDIYNILKNKYRSNDDR